MPPTALDFIRSSFYIELGELNDSNSKLLGVGYIKSTGKWRARLQYTTDGVGRHIGVFSSAYSACNAYWNAKIVLESEMEQHWIAVMEKQLTIAKTIDREK